MKHLSRFTLIASMLITVWSCDKDDFDPTSGHSSEYATIEEVTAVVDSLYRIGAPSFYGTYSEGEVPATMIGGYLSGFFDGQTALWESCKTLSLDDGVVSAYSDGIWDEAYRAIGVCNDLIAGIARTQGLTSQQQSQFVAEARFFRAFSYFYLAKTFGSVPVITENNTPNVGKTGSLSEVYGLIVDDLNMAAGGLSDVGFSRNGFRVGRPAVLSLLADVYLTMSGWPLKQGRYAQAAQAARSVIESNVHSLLANGATPRQSAYNKLRSQSDNIEYIYGYSGTGRSLAMFSLPKEVESWGVVKTRTTDAYKPTELFMNIYDTYGDTRSRGKQFFHSFVKYEKSGRTIIQTFSPRSHWWFDEQALLGKDTVSAGVIGRNAIIYRYAEVLLIAAEAIAMTEGVTSEAAGYLADVRARAWQNVQRESIMSGLMALSRDEFIEEVWEERLREFPFEMKIWPDIQRTRKYPVTTSTDKGNVAFRDVVGAFTPFGTIFEEKHLLLPSPKR